MFQVIGFYNADKNCLDYSEKNCQIKAKLFGWKHFINGVPWKLWNTTCLY